MVRLFFFVLLLIFSQTSNGQANQKKVLIEQFTSTTCPSCGSRNPEFAENILEAYPEEVIHVAYHNGIPLDFDPFYQANPFEVDQRDLYYNVNASPQIVLNGFKQSANNPMLPISWLEPELNQTSAIGIEVEQSENVNGRVANVSVTAFNNVGNDPHSLKVIVVEKHIVFCTYFEYLFDNVFRKFIQTNETETFTAPNIGQTNNYQLEFELEDDWQEDRIYVIAFVQNDSTKEVINVNQSEYFSSASFERACVEDTLHLFATVQPVLCAGTNSGYIDLDMCIDTAPLEDPLENDYTYSWSTGETTQDIYNLSPGNYSVDITQNRTNSTHNYSYTVAGNALQPITANVNSNNETNLDANGSITVNAQGGNGNLSILWNTGATSFQLQNLSAGTYTAIISDENGCSYSISATVESSVDDLQITSNSLNAITCYGFNNGSVDISVSGGVEPYDIDWSNGEDTEDVNGLPPGSYSVNVTDATGMMASQNYLIVEPPQITISEIVTPEFDGNMDGSVIIEITGGTGNYNINWSNGENTTTINNLTEGIYSVEITDENNCTVLGSYTVEAVEEGGVIVEAVGVSCNGLNDGEVSFTSFGDISIESYIWFGNGNSGINLTGLAPGDYDYAAVDENNEVVFGGTFTIDEPAAITFDLNTSNGFETGFVEVENLTGGTPAYNYLWNNGSEEPIINNIDYGTYTLTVSDVNGCSESASATIFENVIEVNHVQCAGETDGSINFIINDGQDYIFDWSDGTNLNSLTNIGIGPYSVGVIDEQNQVFPFIFEITEPTAIEINSLNESDTGSGGAIITNVSGGTPPYQWLWNDGSTDTSINGVAGDNFVLTITDANNCEVTQNYSISSTVNTIDLNGESIKVYPNPASTFINIENLTYHTEIKLFDIVGKNHLVTTNQHSNQVQLSVKNLAEGIYFIESTIDGVTETTKILIAH